MRRELEPPAYVLHTCAVPDCDRLAFAARCDVHETDEDRELLAAMHDAILLAAEAEERWLAALHQALDAERVAGISRVAP